jgi:protein phosphatase
MRWELPIRYASISDIGFRRRNNQDSCAIRICSDQATWREHGHLLLVADGMGGHAVGELASKIAADTVCHTFFKLRGLDPSSALKQSFETANATINERGSLNRDFARMGTTCTGAVFCSEGIIIGHVGDSRLYRVRGERIDQLTFDHSLQWEMIRQGRKRPEEVFLHESRHVITRSLGPEPAVQVDIEGPYPVLPEDVYVICSDGLTGHVQDAEIGIIARGLPPQEACRLLAHLANLRGGADNITVVVARVGSLPGVEVEEEVAPPMTRGMGRAWMLAIWALAIVFVSGVTAILFDKFMEGLLLVAVAAFSAVGVFAFWLEKRPRRKSGLAEGDGTETALWQPYRTTSARSSMAFLNHLANLEADLQRAATEERWTVDWSAHEVAIAAARKSLETQDPSQALADLAKVLDILMAGLLHFRKQLNRQSKWGKPPAPRVEKSGG